MHACVHPRGQEVVRACLLAPCTLGEFSLCCGVFQCGVAGVIALALIHVSPPNNFTWLCLLSHLRGTALSQSFKTQIRGALFV